MNIAIVGYGRMGHEIEKIAKERGHTTVTFDTRCKADRCELTDETLKEIDVAIDFTVPDTAIKNAKIFNRLGINTVMGTTGWYDDMDEMKGSVKDIGFIWSGNYAIGMNLFYKIIEDASKLIDKAEIYDILAYEMHHKGKKDSPSGTAKMIGDIILKNVRRKDKIVTGRLDRQIKENELHFASVRGGSIPGTHSILFDSDDDTIELIHTARGRSGLARGAVLAAEWIERKKGFFGIDDLMKQFEGH